MNSESVSIFTHSTSAYGWNKFACLFLNLLTVLTPIWYISSFLPHCSWESCRKHRIITEISQVISWIQGKLWRTCFNTWMISNILAQKSLTLSMKEITTNHKIIIQYIKTGKGFRESIFQPCSPWKAHNPGLHHSVPAWIHKDMANGPFPSYEDLWGWHCLKLTIIYPQSHQNLRFN